MPENKTITYFGVLKSITSWAKVVREMLSALIKLGADINIYERKGFLYDRNFQLPEIIRSRISNTFKGGYVFTFENPGVYHYLPENTVNIGFLVCEFSSLPVKWVEQINRHLALVFVPSDFCRKIFLESGVEKTKIRVLRYGFNPEYYKPSEVINSDRRIFTFLSIANPHKREGIEYLLEGFSRAFKNNENVRLKLKLSYIPDKNSQNFEYRDIKGLIRKYQRIETISEPYTEEEMALLYQNSDCYVSLSRCEAFGLCFLEAVACGIPVIALDYSGQSDFLNSRNAFFVKYKMVKTRGEEYLWINHSQLIARPSVKESAGIMLNVYNMRPKHLLYHPVLLPEPSYYHWSVIASEFAEEIKKM